LEEKKMRTKHIGKKTPVTILVASIGVALQLSAYTAAAQEIQKTTAPAQKATVQDKKTPTQQATAQETSPPVPVEGAPEFETIVVQGIRQTQRTSNEVKRESDIILDALVSDEIGASPDLSVGETLERITGVSADRFKGSASEISVRGLGPFLGFSTFNGREVSSGSGDRAVSFQQFPSDIVNGVVVYKSQRANLVEGGVSGIIDLQTVQPLDYGKKRFQLDLRGSYNEYQDRVQGDNGLGFRGSVSGITQWDTSIGRIGAAIGYSHIDSSAPEDFYTASSSFRPCNSINTAPTAVSGGTAGVNCSYSAASTNPVYFVGNGYTFRQLSTVDDREALVGAVQWRPNTHWNINLDFQASTRQSIEDRHDLNLAEGRRGIAPTEIADNGALLTWRGNSVLDNINTIRNREEDYFGGGLNIEWRALDNLVLSTDVSYSKTEREQLDLSARLRSNTLVGAGGRVAYSFDQRTGFPTFITVTPVDLDNAGLFTTGAFARRQAESREDEIRAVRFDARLNIAEGWFSKLEAGLRYSDHDRVTDLSNNNNLETIGAVATAAGQSACALAFPQEDWGRNSGTNISSWAVFDTRCLYRNFTGFDDLGPLADSRSADDINVNEKTMAAYFLANFTGELGSVPYTGNFGLRAARTNISSTGFRGNFNVTISAGSIVLVPIAGSFSPVNIKNEFTDILPSANVSFELRPDLLLRGAAYRAMARPNIEDMGAGRTFVLDASGTTIADAIGGVSGGNPRLEPLLSNNFDLSLEWYPNKDTALTMALYYKQLSAGIVPAAANSLVESFEIGGTGVLVPVAQQKNDSEKSYLHGVEVTAQHAMTYLPGIWSRLGFTFGYNYADSNFEYPDPSATDPLNPLARFTDPVGIVGFSRQSGSASVYFENDKLTLRALYKYRSEYSKPFELTANRVVKDAGFLDLSADFRINKYTQLRFQVLNVLNQNQEMYRPVEGSRAETSYFGTTYFFGVRFRF
jgi:iron complex outermembrane recepter protein